MSPLGVQGGYSYGGVQVPFPISYTQWREILFIHCGASEGGVVVEPAAVTGALTHTVPWVFRATDGSIVPPPPQDSWPVYWLTVGI